MAVFQDYKWNTSLDNFKYINILYGRNYSGKTTLSRIARALETGNISDKYNSPQFDLKLNDGLNVTQYNLTGHSQTIRVFNEDFVKENLSFITDDEGTINSFAILGEDNTKIEKKIEQIESELGSEEKTGLRGKLVDASSNYQTSNRNWNNKKTDLEGKLSEKATNRQTGIKYQTVLAEPNYNITRIREDVQTVISANYTPITQVKTTKHQELLREQPKQEVPKLEKFDLSYSTLKDTAKDLSTKKIQVSAPIQELLSDAALNNWVREGRTLHQDKRDTCAFCGNTLPDDLMDKLESHFNKESEHLIIEIDQAVTLIDSEITKVPNLFKITLRNFYSEFRPDVEQQIQLFNEKSKLYIKSLEELKRQLGKRKKDIFKPLEFNEPVSVEQDILDVYNKYEEIRRRSNDFTNKLSSKQTQARKDLRLNEVYHFTTDIQYTDEVKEIEDLESKKNEAEKEKETAQKIVTEREEQIKNLRTQLKDESKGADKVNDYLNNYFGHQFLTLEAVKNKEEEANKYRFEITRNGKKAYHLSEGECRLITFCYFMAKLDEIETKGKKLIIWIDDPISSLDANHVFFVYSLIKGKIIDLKIAKQLFISTHNLDFLKYLKRLLDQRDMSTKASFYIINRVEEASSIEIMPDYLKKYVTEFNYLFEQIHSCGTITEVNDSNYKVFYNFGNNARKFLEIYLYYKYPNCQSHDKKMIKFFGDKIAAILTDRINNEYSHLAGTFERGGLPVEVAEMKKTAEVILEKLKEDPDQYQALRESIGIEQA